MDDGFLMDAGPRAVARGTAIAVLAGIATNLTYADVTRAPMTLAVVAATERAKKSSQNESQTGFSCPIHGNPPPFPKDRRGMLFACLPISKSLRFLIQMCLATGSLSSLPYSQFSPKSA